MKNRFTKEDESFFIRDELTGKMYPSSVEGILQIINQLCEEKED